MATSKVKKNPWKLAVGIFIIAFIVLGAFVFVAVKTQEDNEKILAAAIAVIPVKGEIGASDDLVKQIRKADRDDSVKGIILEIDSPGGSVLPSKEIADSVKAAKKPTVAWIRSTGASGAYWIASAADKIVADETSVTGSIGVIGSYLDYQGLFQKYGINYDQFVSGPYKDTGTPYRTPRPDEQQYFQQKINALKDMFVDAVAENRNMSREKVARLATGEIFLGNEALSAGLIDVLGGRQEAQNTMQQLAGLKDSRLVAYETPKGLLSLFTNSAESFAYWIGKGIGDSFKPQVAGSVQLLAR
jgi:protease IV